MCSLGERKVVGSRKRKKERRKKINQLIRFQTDGSRRKLVKILRGSIGRPFRYDEIQRFYQETKENPLCGYIRAQRELGGQIMGFCSLANSVEDADKLCEDVLPMKKLHNCPVYNLFRRRNDSPYRSSMYIYRDERGYLKMRFYWKQKEIAASIYLKGRKSLGLDRVVVEGVCDDVKIIDGKIAEDISEIRTIDRDSLKLYLWNHASDFYGGLREVLSPQDYKALRTTETLKQRVRYGRVA
jgi:hypothetical protein